MQIKINFKEFVYIKDLYITFNFLGYFNILNKFVSIYINIQVEELSLINLGIDILKI